jgi:hypothetical protein
MQTREHRPPVDLTQETGSKESSKKTVHQKGKLRYAGNEGGGDGGGGKLNLGTRGGGGRFRGLGGGKAHSFTMTALAVGISLLLAFLLFTPKSSATTLLANQRYLEGRVNAANANLTQANARIDNIISSYATKAFVLDNSVTLETLEGYVTLAQLNEATSDMEGYWLVNSTLYAKSRPGTYMARISLIYPTPYGLNATSPEEASDYFAGNWTGQDFVPEFGPTYEVVGAFYYTGAFNITESEWSGSIGNFSAPETYIVGAELIAVK